MAISVVMPALEMAQDTGKLVSWRKNPGEPVAKGEILLEVETDKAVVEVEALADGVLAGVKAQPGDVVPVGQTIAWLLGPGETVPARAAPIQAATDAARTGASFAPSASSASAQAAKAGPGGGSQVRISPKARRLAKEHNVDIATLRGSGAEGEILAADILDAARSTGANPSTAAPSADEGNHDTASVTAGGTTSAGEEKLTAIGRLMAERTTQSWTTVPHFFVTREVEATALNEARGQLSAEIEKSHGVRPTHTDLLVALVARTLARHPRLNATWTGNGIRMNPEINVAVAMAVDDGVVTAVIRSAAKLGVGQIAGQRRDLTERARANRLRPEDIAGATFTISNLGMHHVDSFTAIIVPPQAAILAVSAIKDRVVPVDGHPGVRPVISLTLSSDHRVVDGARAAAFLNDLAGMLQQPQMVVGP